MCAIIILTFPICSSSYFITATFLYSFSEFFSEFFSELLLILFKINFKSIDIHTNVCFYCLFKDNLCLNSIISLLYHKNAFKW